MKAPRRGISCLVFLMAMACVFAVPETAQAQPKGRERGEALAEGRKLLKQGRYDEALVAYADWAHFEMGKGLLQLAQEAERDRKTEHALRLYEAYFHYYPFGGYLNWINSRGEWMQAAAGYLALLEKIPKCLCRLKSLT